MVFQVPFSHAWAGYLLAAGTSLVESMSNSGRPSRRSTQRPDAEDTVMRRLSPVDKDRLGVDAWEPSLLRKMLRAKGVKPVESSDG